MFRKIAYNQMKAFLDKKIIPLRFFSPVLNLLSLAESALLRVFNILQATDSGNYVILVLLHSTAPFDTVDHRILLSCLWCRHSWHSPEVVQINPDPEIFLCWPE